MYSLALLAGSGSGVVTNASSGHAGANEYKSSWGLYPWLCELWHYMPEQRCLAGLATDRACCLQALLVCYALKSALVHTWHPFVDDMLTFSGG